MRVDGSKVYIRLLAPGDEGPLLQLRRRNEAFLRPWEPARPDDYLEPESQARQLRRAVADADTDTTYAFGVFTFDDELVGTVTLANVVRGAWQNATIGYFIDEAHNGHGLATEAISLTVRLAFSELDLHRVQAAVMPHNPASVRVLEKAGFRHEGSSERYLRIADRWEDHLILAITSEDLAL